MAETSSSETAPLNPPQTEETLLDPYFDDTRDDIDEDELPTLKPKRDSLYILIFHGLSLAVSLGGFGCAIWGYCIVRTAPFDEGSKTRERQSYESNFLSMQSIVVLLSVNILWSGMNFFFALKGRSLRIERLVILGPIFDFLLWALLIGFGVLNMVEILLDRRLCDGHADQDLYDKCDKSMFRLLVVEMIAVNLGLLVAVLHFIMLIARCCTCGAVQRSLELRERIAEEEQILLVLRDRRKRLLEETQALEERGGMGDRPLSLVSSVDDAVEEDLIDMTAHEQGRATNPVPNEVDSSTTPN